ncbi:MAG: 4-hydroxy-tetrahydrodipicolinate synthase [Oscillospiraceae bacterium]|jgi:4-hydroxy-tetrahydrodipicolinate synthase|nr:4-hydroxy-tetrahydrodipicolinate synthase [Oscillospiraceae bacterium]
MALRLFEGSGCAMVTPFTQGNVVDTAALQEQAAFQLESGTAALIVCGTTGEAATMSPEEQAQAVRAVAQVAYGRAPVIAGVGGNHTAKAIAASLAAREAGADAVLAVTPYYNKTTPAGLVAHFTAIADASPLPVILYNVPSRTNVNITPAVAARLAEHPNIIAIKEASGDIAQVADTVRLCGEEMAVYSGNDECTLAVLALGGLGVISVAANVAPAAMAKLCAAFFAGDLKAARDEQLRLMPLIRALFSEVNPIPVKAAMRMQGWRMGALRLPLTEIGAENRENLRACLRAAGVLQSQG